MPDAKINTTWEDSGTAGIDSIICECGHVIKDSGSIETKPFGREFECSECGNKYEGKWVGMTIEKVKE